MSHTYTPAPAHAIAQAPADAHAPATRGSTCVTCKWLMPLEIRPSHSLPLCNVRKRTNKGKNFPYKRIGFKVIQPFQVEFNDKPRKRVEDVAKKKNSYHNCGSTDHYANNCPKAKKKVYAIEKVTEEEYPTDDSESDSMGDAIREQSDDDQGPREEFLVKYQEEKPLDIQDIYWETSMPQATANKNLCKHTQDAQAFLVKPTKVMEYINETATKMNFFI
ncbi:hypothetical protein O181_057552 [Austropuccinia psidii MF-1]|uniref:CCHC-type domain-containing protein n=1 Tax=Austropuccinia psidii MF-1 TaxID=1389203 RepID=A0A9Q3ECZ8_9BASI|nr:hypothetical protein [Austropuccinia psidii MF-1]